MVSLGNGQQELREESGTGKRETRHARGRWDTNSNKYKADRSNFETDGVIINSEVYLDIDRVKFPLGALPRHG